MAIEDAYTVSLVHFNGIDGTTVFDDDREKVWTAGGNAQLDTAQKVFGSASGLFDGAGDFISTPDHADFHFGYGEFCIDFRLRLGEIDALQMLVQLCSQAPTQYFGISILANNNIKVFFPGNFSNDYTWSPSVDTWYHVAVTRDASKDVRVFIDGTQIGITNNRNRDVDTTGISYVGIKCWDPSPAYSNPFQGQVDELRTCKGAARWTADFTPPSAEYDLGFAEQVEGVSLDDDTWGQIYTGYQTEDAALDDVAWGQNYTAYLTESVGMDDDMFAIPFFLTEDAEFGDTAEAWASILGVNAEAVDLDDVIRGGFEYEVSLTEAVGMGDTGEVFNEYNLGITDGVAADDAAGSGDPVSITEILTFYETLGWAWGKTAADAIDFTETVVADVSMGINETLTLRETTVSNWTGTEEIESILEALDAALTSWEKTIADGVDFTDAAAPHFGRIVRETLDLAGTLVANYTGTEEVESLIGLAGRLAIAWPKSITDSITVADTVSPEVAILIREILDLGETLVANYTGTEALESVIGLIGRLAIAWPKSITDSIAVADTVSPEVAILIREILELTETLVANYTGTEEVESLIGLIGRLAIAWPKSITDSIAVADTVTPEVALLIREILDLAETLVANWTGTEEVESTLNVLGRLIIGQIFNETATSSVVITDISTYLHQMISAISDTVGFAETLASQAELNPVITEAVAINGLVAVLSNLYNTNTESLVLTDTPGFAWSKAITDTMAITDSPEILWYCMNALTDSIALTEAVLNQFQFNDAITDAIEFATTLALNQILTNTVTDTIDFGIVIELDGELWETWVLNTNAFHASVYSGYSFNSYAVYNNAAYGCKTDGIYRLSGSTDDGSEFKSGIVFPETRFGTHHYKRFRKAYFGIAGTSPSIKLTNEDGTSKTYTIERSKITPTRGVKGRQWTLSVEGFDSLDFVELAPLILTK